MINEFVLRELDIDRDAEKLATMWNESDDQWPGTWTGGVPLTAETMREWYKHQDNIAVYVFEADHRIAGYCSFNKRMEEKGVGYVGLLNVHPAYQGKSLGRRLLQRCLERCGELGFRLLTLETWSGNLKSVPLYKKTGFFWVPDTSVWMVNFIPSILNLACARPFFERHDWYRTFKRQLRQAEDDERWEGMKVFTYRWEEDGEALTVWADREAHTLAGVETDAFLAAATADNIEPPKGLPTRLRWRLRNKQARPMSVSLIASGTEHIQLDYRTSLTVAPGEAVEMEADVLVKPDAPDTRPHQPVPTVRTLLILDGEVLELGAGLRLRPTVAIDTAPHYVTLCPGVPKTVHLQLRSYLREDTEATVSLAPAPGLKTDWTERQVALPAKGVAALPVELVAADGVHPLHATVFFAGGKTLPEELPIMCLPAGGVLAHQGAQGTRIENEWIRLILKPRGGDASIFAARNGTRLTGFVERVGPPFWPSELSDKEYNISLDRSNGRIRAVMTADMEMYPGLTVRREVIMGAGPLVEFGHTLINNGTVAHNLQVSRHFGNPQREQAIITLPLTGGIVQGHMAEFPTADEDISRKPEAFLERWAAFTYKAYTVGVLWEKTIVDNEVHSWRTTLVGPQLDCAPQQWTPAGKCYLYAGPGDWRTVREQARRLSGTDDVPEPIPARTRPVQDVRLEPAPLVTLDDQVLATLVVDNLRCKSLDGRVRLTLPEDLAADRKAFEVQQVSSEKPLHQEVTLTLTPAARAYEVKADLETRLFDTQVSIPVIRLGNREPIAVTRTESHGQEIYTIANGRTTFTIAPGFSGALTGWEEDGANHVLSPFPEQKTFGWMSPWYGGITPIVIEEDVDFPGKLDQESLVAQIVDLSDARGIPWRGVRLTSKLTREKLVGLQLELDYLTVGHSNILKLACRVHNTTTAKRHLEIGWISFWKPDGNSTANVLRSEEIERKHTPWSSWPEAGFWGAVVSPESGRTAVLTSSYPSVRLMDWGGPGGHLGWFSGIDVMPRGTTERVCYLALCKSFAEAHPLTWLRQYT